MILDLIFWCFHLPDQANRLCEFLFCFANLLNQGFMFCVTFQRQKFIKMVPVIKSLNFDKRFVSLFGLFLLTVTLLSPNIANAPCLGSSDIFRNFIHP